MRLTHSFVQVDYTRTKTSCTLCMSVCVVSDHPYQIYYPIALNLLSYIFVVVIFDYFFSYKMGKCKQDLSKKETLIQIHNFPPKTRKIKYKRSTQFNRQMKFEQKGHPNQTNFQNNSRKLLCSNLTPISISKLQRKKFNTKRQFIIFFLT